MVAGADLARVAITAALAICAVDGAVAQATRELTPAAALATTRIMRNQVLPGHAIDDALASPDGKRYLLRTAHGDAPRNGVWVDLYTGSLGSLAVTTPRRCAHLFTTGLGPQFDDVGANWDPTSANILQWVNNHRVAFLWADAHEVRQVMTVDLISCQHRYLTHNITSVYGFAVTTNGTLLMDARMPRRSPVPKHRWEDGFTLPESTDAWAVLRNDVDSGSFDALQDDTKWSVSSRYGTRQISVSGDPVDGTNPSLRPLILSPNGRFAITYAGLKKLPEAWRAYPDHFVQLMLDVNSEDPGRSPTIFLIFDLKTASSHPLWSAPRRSRCEFAFSPDSRWVLAAPTFVPLPTRDAAALSGNAAAVIDPRTGDFVSLPIDLEHRNVVRLAWETSERIVIQSTDSDGRGLNTDRFRLVQGRWTIDAAPPVTEPLKRSQIQIRQTLNDPPTIWAVSDGGERLLLDLNPHLKNDFKLGRVERRSGTLPDGHSWIGQLIYPADYQRGTRYPLVIQSIYGMAFGPEEFTLDGSWGAGGMGLGPSEYPAYPGQLLASRNVAVLQLELLHPDSGVQEAEGHQLMFETVAEELVAAGLVDRNKVALAGFSRNGYWVEYTLSHSRFPFAAAIAQDNYDPSYFQSALAGWWSFDADMNGAPAFGRGLQSWLEHAPGFNAERIHTPLRMMGQSLGGILYLMSEWEIYSRLRHLHKPVEIAVMPDINGHPSHNTQNPRQIMAIQESSLDWLSFWLTGREDASPQKREQYTRWHRFRDLQSSNTSGNGSAEP